MAQCVVFGSPVTGLEKDHDQSRLQIIRTDKDHNHGLVYGPLQIQNFQDQAKTGLTG